MSKCGGLHCPGCGDGGGGGGLIAGLVALVVIGAAIRAAWHVIVGALEIAACVVCGAVALAAVLAIAYAALRIRSHVASSRPQRTIPARAEVIRLGAIPERGAIEAARTPEVRGQPRRYGQRLK